MKRSNDIIEPVPVFVPSETFAELLGAPYHYTPRGWVKIFGAENAEYYKSCGTIKVSREFIWREYNQTREDGAVTPLMAQILMYAYCHWIKFLSGSLETHVTEEIHHEIIMMMAKFHNINMKTESPINSILNLMTRIKKQHLYKYYGDLTPKSKNNYYQRRYNTAMRTKTFIINPSLLGELDIEAESMESDMRHWDFGRDCYHEC